MKCKEKIILASASPRRSDILKEMGISFKVYPSDIDESSKFKRPSAIVKDIAFSKTFEVAHKFPNEIVLGADTLVFCDGKLIGKPKDKEDAFKILSYLNGKWQSIYTAVVAMHYAEQKIIFGYEVSKCKARKLSADKLRKYSVRHLDKSGAYSVQDKDDPFIERYVGDYDNIVGLPKKLTKQILTEIF